MSRQSNLSKSAAVTGPPAEQDMPLDIPKKSKLCVEQVRRGCGPKQKMSLESLRAHVAE
jgi:hypothetical protein